MECKQGKREMIQCNISSAFLTPHDNIQNYEPPPPRSPKISFPPPSTSLFPEFRTGYDFFACAYEEFPRGGWGFGGARGLGGRIYGMQ